ncbi:MAG: hypothetical protein JJT82_07460 [Legionellaceae bacterium]|nr:hypothetical protein [Legionellaceae bacterium]
MIYLWEMPEYCPNKHIAEYDYDHSPDYFLLRDGVKLNSTEFGQCYAYCRSSLVDLADDFFIRTVVRHHSQLAYIFTEDEMFSFAGGFATKVNISTDKLKKIKTALSLTEKDVDNEPKILSDADMAMIDATVGHPLLTRTPILNLDVTTTLIQKKYDCIPNNAASPLVNQKIIDILLELVPDDVQFFDAKVRCKDGILTNYKLLNLTRTITGIDHEKSIYSLMESTDAILGFKYLTYKPGCMGQYELARDKEYLGNILATDKIKQAFEKAKVKGAWFVRPEQYYRPLQPSDLID